MFKTKQLFYCNILGKGYSVAIFFNDVVLRKDSTLKTISYAVKKVNDNYPEKREGYSMAFVAKTMHRFIIEKTPSVYIVRIYSGIDQREYIQYER